MAEHLLQGERGQVHTYSTEPVTVIESKLTLLGHMISQWIQVNEPSERWGVEAQNTDREDGGLASQNNHLIVGQVLWQNRGGVGEEGEQSEKAMNLVNISQNGKSQAGDALNFFLPAYSTGQRPEQRHLTAAEVQGSLRQAIHSDHSTRSHEKQVKETLPTQSQNWLLPCNSSRHSSWQPWLGMTHDPRSHRWHKGAASQF